MEKTAVSVVLCALTLLLLSLTGCGGDNSTPKEAPAAVFLSGVVEDGPIENAKISLRDQGNNILAVSNSVTDTTGAFSLQVPAGTLFTNLSVVAVGGRDRATGVDFTGLELRSPLALFSDNVSAIVISPLTTLVAKLHEQGTPLAVAQERLRIWLALPAATNLAVRPSASLDLQRRTLLLSKIALEIKSVATDSDPFSRISTLTMPLDAATANHESMSALGLDVAAQARVRELQTLLATAATVDDAVFIYKREELIGIFAANVEQMLAGSASFDPLNASYRENLRLVTEATLQAAGREVITLGGTIPQRIVRYILFTYKLRTWESLKVDAATFAAALTPLASDLWVAELARSRSLYSVVSPLQLAELPGNDNQQRVAYFYDSDLSPHYLAEQLLGRVFDDAINDAVLLKIIEGKANAGLVDETQAIIATQIVQSEAKANAYLVLAKTLIKFNRPQEAVNVLNLARDLYRQVIAAKGVASSSSTDVFNLLETSRYYRVAGALSDAESLLMDIADIAQALKTDALSFGRLITGIKNVADAYIAAGDYEAAGSLVESMYLYSGLTPSYKNTYQLRIYNWSEGAKRFAALGDKMRVLQIYSDIKLLREADAATATATWPHLPDVVESLYRVGATVEALTLASTIPSGTTNQTKAFKLVAIYEALQGNWENIDNATYFPKVEDRLELLTYFAANKKNPGIALSLIAAGRFSEARQALQKAEELLAGMNGSTNLAKIRYGYVKVAELYAQLGDNLKATELLHQAQESIIDDVYRVTVMADIALGYLNLNQKSEALALLDSAQSFADINPTLYRADTTPKLGKEEYATLLYEKLIKAYEKIGEKSRIRTIIVNSFKSWAEQIHTAGTVDDALAGKECDYLLRAALYLEHAGFHAEALITLDAAKKLTNFKIIGDKIVGDVFAVTKTLFTNYQNVITTYATMHEYEQSLNLALAWPLTTERNQAIQSLANATIARDDFPTSAVATIDTDGDGKPDFFHPLASADETAASGLLLDDDSDGDGIVDTLDLRPLFAD